MASLHPRPLISHLISLFKCSLWDAWSFTVDILDRLHLSEPRGARDGTVVKSNRRRRAETLMRRRFGSTPPSLGVRVLTTQRCVPVSTNCSHGFLPVSNRSNVSVKRRRDELLRRADRSVASEMRCTLSASRRRSDVDVSLLASNCCSRALCRRTSSRRCCRALPLWKGAAQESAGTCAENGVLACGF